LVGFVLCLALTTAGTGPVSAQAAPTFEISPASGPVGAVVHFSGQVDPSQIAAYQNPAYFTLVGEIKDCELLVNLQQTAITVDPSGTVSGSFVVGGSGQCFQQEGTRQVVAGPYNLAISCHACFVGSFTITSGQKLARTGAASLPLAMMAMCLIAAGAACVGVSRRLALLGR
jgi:hypothetical protein